MRCPVGALPAADSTRSRTEKVGTSSARGAFRVCVIVRFGDGQSGIVTSIMARTHRWMKLSRMALRYTGVSIAPLSLHYGTQPPLRGFGAPHTPPLAVWLKAFRCLRLSGTYRGPRSESPR